MPPFVLLLFGDEECRGVADEIQNARALHAYAEKGIQRGEHERQDKSHLREREDREKQTYSYQSDVVQSPEPQRCF